MKLINEVFSKCSLIEESLIPYGFNKVDGSYFYNVSIHNGEFELRITIKDKNIDAKLIDSNFGDEFNQIDLPVTGSFVTSLKEEIIKILTDIKEHCYKKEEFAFPQTNRIALLIKEKYGIIPERLNFGRNDNAIFRNPISKKWVGLVLVTKKSNIIGDSEEFVEALNMNFIKDKGNTEGKGIYRPYKGKNQYWIVVILDDTLNDEEVMSLVDRSYQYSME